MTRIPAASAPLSPRASTLLLAALVVTAGIYAIGLRGGFLFDDVSFLVHNPDVQVRAPAGLDAWYAAAHSFPAEHQGRWLTMLSFALNHYLTGLDPFWLKATNLAIHLGNGLLLFALLRALFALWRACVPQASARDTDLIAAVLAFAWLVLPVNVSAVLYVAQRLESLSTSFVLLGLWWYLHARRRHFEGGSALGMFVGLGICTGVGLLFKESAAMLPLFAFCAEWALPRGRNASGRLSRPTVALYALTLGLPLLAGAVWLASWVGGPTSYARPFSTLQRLLTEGRVLVDYVQWTLLPNLHELSFFHDDIAISHSLLDPPSTLACLLGLAAAAIGAFLGRHRLPLCFLGVLWFFAGHLLTATVIPLELAFEHRNYFPSIGLLLAVASLAGLETPVRARPGVLLAAAGLLFFCTLTFLQARDWSDPLRFALTQVQKRPQSHRAQAELASTLLEYSDRATDAAQREALVAEALKIVRAQIAEPSAVANIIPYQIQIMYEATHHLPVDQSLWEALIQRLQQHPPSESDMSALGGLFQCRLDKICQENPRLLLEAFLAALEHPPPKPKLMALYADFVAVELDDNVLAERIIRDTLVLDPGRATLRASLVRLLLVQGKIDPAREELDRLRQSSHWGINAGMIRQLESEYASQAAQAQGAAPPPSAETPGP